jgi:hypothetical protein
LDVSELSNRRCVSLAALACGNARQDLGMISFAPLLVAHVVGDLLLQSDRVAGMKATRSWRGRLVCAEHVGIIAAVSVVLLASAGVGLSARVLAGLAINAVSHYVADRRWPLMRLACATGKAGWVERGGLQWMDQGWHIAWLWAAALIIG